MVIYQPVVLFPNGIFTLDISPETRNREQVSRLTASPAQGVRLVMALAKAGSSLRCSYCQQFVENRLFAARRCRNRSGRVSSYSSWIRNSVGKLRR